MDVSTSSSRPGRVAGVVTGLLAMAPASALACPVCALVGTGNNTWAYQVMSLVLTVLPLGMIGGAVWYAARALRRADEATSPVGETPRVEVPSLGAPAALHHRGSH